MSTKQIERVDLIWLIALLSLSPLLYVHGTHLWERPHFQFFPIAWGCFAYLAYSRAKVSETKSKARFYCGIAIGVLAILAEIVAVWYLSPWLGCVGAILLITSWAFTRLGEAPWTRVLSWSMLLWVTLPLPLNMDTTLIQKLQWTSASSASEFLDVVGMPHLRLGNRIEVQGKELLVDEACSGVDSLYSLFAVAILIVNWQSRPLLVGLGLILSVPLWAWLGNFIRLVTIALSLYKFELDLSHGWQHTVLGLVVFSFSFCALWLTLNALEAVLQRFPTGIKPREGRGLYMLYNQIVCWPGVAPKLAGDSDEYFSSGKHRSDHQRGKSGSTGFQSPQPLLAIPEKLLMIGLGACVLLGAGAAYQITRQSTLVMHPEFSREALESTLKKARMSQAISGATITDYRKEKRPSNSFEGEHSAVWQYKHAAGNIVLSLDFPFRGFHELWKCYEANGYVIAKPHREIGTRFTALASEKGVRITWPVHHVVFVNDLGEFAYLWFSMLGPEIEAGATPDSVLDNRLSRYVGKITYQFQMFVATGDELTSADEQAMMQMFVESSAAALNIVKDLDNSLKSGANH